MEKVTLSFSKEKDGKNSVRYQEQPEAGQPPKIGSLYVQKWVLGTPVPDNLTVTVEMA